MWPQAERRTRPEARTSANAKIWAGDFQDQAYYRAFDYNFDYFNNFINIHVLGLLVKIALKYNR